MATRFYIVPKVGAGMDDDAIRPKYIGDGGINYSAMDYGLENVFLVGADVTDAQHASLAAQIDVIAIPSDLDSLVSITALTTVQSRMEGILVPAEWLTTGNSYRDVIRTVGKLFLLMQRFHGTQLRKLFSGTVTLDTRLNQLSRAERDALTDTAVSLGLDVTGVTTTMTVRQAIKFLADQLPPFVLRGETF